MSPHLEQGLGADLCDLPSETTALSARKMFDEKLEVVEAFPQWGESNRDDGEAIVEVLAESSGGNFLL